MFIKKLVIGPLEVNCYVVVDEITKTGIVIDPGDEPDRIIGIINENKLKIDSIVCTHAHFDHIGAAGDVKKATGARILLNKKDLDLYKAAKDQAVIWGFDISDIPEPDGYLDEGDRINAGNLTFEVLYTPGHSPGGICLYGNGVLFSGDTIFQGSVGRTDFHGGDLAALKKSFKRLLSLDDNTKVLSGHGPETTIARERKENAFVYEWL